MIESTFNLEQKLMQKGYKIIVGIDEAGRGPLAGPVVACATTVRNSQFLISNFQSNPNYKLQITNYDLIRDSKTLSEHQRESIYDFIQEKFFIGVGICDHKTVDRMNILQASFLAMKKALTNLQFTIYNLQSISNNQILKTKASEKINVGKRLNDSELKNSKFNQNSIKIQNSKRIVLVDGNQKIPNFSEEQIAIPQGDQKIKSISAASIIAKVTRDRIMREMHKVYPQYGFDRHKGYGTKFHLEALKKYGPCKIHRRSFAPVKQSETAKHKNNA